MKKQDKLEQELEACKNKLKFYEELLDEWRVICDDWRTRCSKAEAELQELRQALRIALPDSALKAAFAGFAAAGSAKEQPKALPKIFDVIVDLEPYQVLRTVGVSQSFDPPLDTREAHIFNIDFTAGDIVAQVTWTPPGKTTADSWQECGTPYEVTNALHIDQISRLRPSNYMPVSMLEEIAKNGDKCHQICDIHDVWIRFICGDHLATRLQNLKKSFTRTSQKGDS